MSTIQVERAAPHTAPMQGWWSMIRQNIRDYGMVAVLVVIILFFTWRTNGIFISPRNIANLLNQMGYIGVLATGMTLVIVLRHIDLSVGFLSGFLAAVATIAMVQFNVPWYLAILLALALGIAAGTVTALLIGWLRIPAFVATLGGWLIYRGCCCWSLQLQGR